MPKQRGRPAIFTAPYNKVYRKDVLEWASARSPSVLLPAVRHRITGRGAVW